MMAPYYRSDLASGRLTREQAKELFKYYWAKSWARTRGVGNVLFGAAAMLAYALGMGSLIIICGTFSGFLAALPRSGRWLNVVEKVFAVLMILVAEFFLIYLGQNANFPLLSTLFSFGS